MSNKVDNGKSKSSNEADFEAKMAAFAAAHADMGEVAISVSLKAGDTVEGVYQGATTRITKFGETLVHKFRGEDGGVRSIFGATLLDAQLATVEAGHVVAIMKTNRTIGEATEYLVRVGPKVEGL